MHDYAVDDATPHRIVRPKDAADLARQLADAHADRAAVIPWGGGTRMHVGNVATDYDVAVDLTALNGNVEHVAGDMTLVCDAGVRIADIKRRLREADQRLPFEVRQPASATIGGSVASNAPSRIAARFGGIRDWMIGMSVTLPDGTPTKTGGRVVKNVQGYDLHRLHTGAFGTLGVIASVAVKLVPVAEGTRTVAMWFRRLQEAADAAAQIRNGVLTVESATLYSGIGATAAIRELAANRHMDSDATAETDGYLMLVQISGSKSALTRQVNDLTGLAGTVPADGYEVLAGVAETDVWEYCEGIGADAALTLRVAAKPASCVSLVERLSRAVARFDGGDAASAVDVGYGAMHFCVDFDDDERGLQFIEDATRIVREVGGTAMVERCPVRAKREIDVYSIDAASKRIMQNLKQQFDPQQVLNPGRFAFRI